MDASERYTHYATCFSSQQVARLPEHKPWDHEIPLQDPQAKIPTGAVYKTTWEQDKALQKYLDKNLPTGKVRRSRSATGAPILFVRKKDGSLRLVVVRGCVINGLADNGQYAAHIGRQLVGQGIYLYCYLL